MSAAGGGKPEKKYRNCNNWCWGDIILSNRGRWDERHAIEIDSGYYFMLIPNNHCILGSRILTAGKGPSTILPLSHRSQSTIQISIEKPIKRESLKVWIAKELKKILGEHLADPKLPGPMLVSECYQRFFGTESYQPGPQKSHSPGVLLTLCDF